ncbi:MAG: phosphoglycerate dehydrogenase [Planctomycetia bacterium]|nr:phosphoglycerate dehydrogenase [Planctomycetia bacterium]
MPIVFITPEPLFHVPGPHIELLEEAGFTVRYAERPVLETETETIATLAEAEAVLAGGDPYTDRVLASLPRLRVIARSGVGYDRVDVAAATNRGVVLTITPTANHEAVAEQTMALLLAAARRIAENDRDVRAGTWGKPLLAPLRGRTLGIVGLGRIGRSVAVRAAAFGMRLFGCDPIIDAKRARECGVELVDCDSLLADSDFVSLHVPLAPETRGLINRNSLARMKRGSFLINTARGGLVVESDLAEALASGHLAGAGLDVLADEPPRPDCPLLHAPNVVLSPHVAANDPQAIRDMAMCAAQSIIDLYQGRWPDEAVVNRAVRSRWSWPK